MNLKFFIFLLFFPAWVSATDIEVYFNHPSNVPAVTSDLETVIIDFIDSANTSMDIAIYDLDMTSIANAIVAAKQRGVTVRVITENDNTGIDNQAALDILTNNTVP